VQYGKTTVEKKQIAGGGRGELCVSCLLGPPAGGVAAGRRPWAWCSHGRRRVGWSQRQRVQGGSGGGDVESEAEACCTAV
jgi:hypothetical protein